MNETRRRRLAAIWVAFAAAMAWFAVADGLSASFGDAVSLLTAAFGLALAAVYYRNPGDILSFGT